MDYISTYLARYLGLTLVLAGCFFEFIAAVGVLKVKDFFVRAHVVTLSVIGGTIAPLIGIALISLTLGDLGLGRFYLAALCIVTSMLLLVTAPTGSHALMRAAYISKTKKELNEGAEMSKGR